MAAVGEPMDEEYVPRGVLGVIPEIRGMIEPFSLEDADNLHLLNF